MITTSKIRHHSRVLIVLWLLFATWSCATEEGRERPAGEPGEKGDAGAKGQTGDTGASGLTFDFSYTDRGANNTSGKPVTITGSIDSGIAQVYTHVIN